MKKTILRIPALILLAAMLFSLFSCAERLGETVPESDPGETDSAAKTDGYSVPIADVPDPLIPADLEEIQVANASMSENELRDICVKFCLLQGSFQWTPNMDFRYTATDKNHVFRRGTLYGGLPYTHASSDLYSFLDFYDTETGVLDVSAIKNGFGTLLGNDCADAVFWGWARVSNTISYTLTKNMVPQNGCLKIGNHVYDETAKSFVSQHTRDICNQNGIAVMCRSYALMKPADGVVTWNDEGHAMMIVENHPLAEAGGYSAKDSYVLVAHQHSGISAIDQDGAKVWLVGGIRDRISYQELFNRGYLPVRPAELAGTDPVEKAGVVLRLPGGGEATDMDSLLSATLVSNYRISKILFRLTDEDGNVVYERKRYGDEQNMYTMKVTPAINRSVLRRAMEPDRVYTLSVSALVGTGETVEVFSCRTQLD